MITQLCRLPQSTRCSVHHRTRRCSDMTDHHIHPQHTACRPAGKHPLHPGEHWERPQWSMCLSLGHTCNPNIWSNDCFLPCGWYDETRRNHSSNQPKTQEGNRVPSQLTETSFCLPSLITDVWMVTGGNSFQHRQRTKLKLKAKLSLEQQPEPRESWTHQWGQKWDCWPWRRTKWGHVMWFTSSDIWVI